MTQSVRDLENTFERALQLLASNWFMIVPGLVLGVVGGLLNYVIAAALIGSYTIAGDGSPDAAAIPAILSTLLGLVIAVLIAILQMAYVTGMAGGSWEQGRARWSDGWRAFTHRSIQTFFAFVLLLVIGFCAAFLVGATFYVSLLAYLLFFLYTMASVIIGGQTAVSAVVESCKLALSNILPTLAVVSLIVVIAWLGSRAGDAIDNVNPLAGGIVAAVLQQVIVAYAALVITGEYLKLRKQVS